MTRRAGFVGRLADGSRVEVEIDVRPLNRAETTTVNHETVYLDHRNVEFAASGSIYEPRRREPWHSGQMLDQLLDIATLSDGWTVGDLASLHSIWQRWHLNSMNAACSHMDPATMLRLDDGRPALTNQCPAGSGYRYGQAWLYEPLPDEVLEEIVRLQEKLERGAE